MDRCKITNWEVVLGTPDRVRDLVISPPAFHHRKAARQPVLNGFTGRSLSTEAAENTAL